MNTPIPPKFLKRKTHLHTLVIFFIILLHSFQAWSQQSNLACNTMTPWVDNATFTVFETHSSSGLACWDEDLLCIIPGDHPPANAENADLNDFARGNITGLGSLTLRITETGDSIYSAGNFAGFRIANSGLNLGVLNSTTIYTYLNGVLQETVSGANLLAVGVNLTGDIFDVGFVTTLPFDAIEISVSALIAIGFFDIYYAIIADFCPGPELECNIQTQMNLPVYPMTIDYLNTGTSGVGVGSVTDPEDAISASTTDFANLTTITNIAGSIFITIEEQATVYPGGTFAGFDIENLTVGGVDLLNNIVVTTYLDGVQQENVSGTNLILGAPLLSTDGRHVVGFVTTLDFNEVRLTLTQPLNVSLGTTRVYSAIFREFCPGDPLPCNTLNAPTLPEYPLYIDDEHTGITGILCVGCSVNNSDRVIDADLTNYATIVLTAGVFNVGSLAVKDQLTDYPAGTFAGFHIENPVLVDANILEGITISTYLDGDFQEQQTNVGALLTVGTGLLVNTGEHIVGFVSTMPFDEVKISLVNTVNVDLGTTRIYNLVIEPFCAATILCDTTYYLTNPVFPVYINSQRTGVDGLACVACEVEDEQNLLTADTSDFAVITIALGVAGTSSISVADALYTYPAGTFAGFVIEDPAFLIEAELFETLTISTYNNNTFQESRTGADLIDLAALVLFISADEGRYNVGFETTMPFDEIRITVGSLATAINIIRVYAAFVDTRASNGGSLLCVNGPMAVDDVAVTDEDTPVSIDVLANDSDPDSPLGIPTIASPPNNGMVTVNPVDSSIVYTPDSGFVGIDTFTYSICDDGMPPLCDTASVIVTVLPARDTIMEIILQDSTVEWCAWELVNLPGEVDTIIICNLPESGILMMTDTCIQYTPDPVFIGLDTICVMICDTSVCDTTIIIIIVEPLLPVRWLTFQVEKLEGRALLTWTTVDELRNAGFEVQRSQDGKQFEEIGFVAAPAVPKPILHYQFIDDHPQKGMNYYRIRQVDLDGKSGLSPVRSVKFGESSFHVSLWPNPSDGQINLSLSGIDGEDIQVRIIGSNGNVVYVNEYQHDDLPTHLQIDHLPPGVYYLMVTTLADRFMEQILILK